VEPADANEQAWAFNQFSKLYGKLTVVVSRDNLRFIRPAKGITTAFNSKTNELIIYNSTYKSYYKTDLTKFEKLEEARLQMLEGYLSDLPMTGKKMPEKIAGIAVQRFTLAAGHKGEKSTGRWDSDKVFSLDSISMEEADLWTTSDIALSAGNQKAIQILYHMPPKPGIPLKMSLRAKKGGKKEMELDTVAVSKTTFPAQFMKPPADYVKVAEYANVVHQAQSGSYNGMMQYFDAFHKMGQ
jgi:hypothetical protein